MVDDDKRPTNPWLVVLWVLAVALTAAGGFMVSQTAQPATGGLVPVLVLPAVYTALAPWVLGVGLGAVVAAVCVQAIRWPR